MIIAFFCGVSSKFASLLYIQFIRTHIGSPVRVYRSYSHRHAILVQHIMGSFCSYCGKWGKCESDGRRHAWMPRLSTVRNPYAILCDACVIASAPHGRYLHRVLKLPPDAGSIIAACTYPVYAESITRAKPLRDPTGAILEIDA